MKETLISGSVSADKIVSRIPSCRYTSPEFTKKENEKLWPYVWQMACREVEVASPGQYYEYQLGAESIIIIRDRSGQLQAFYNACRHRGMRLLEGKGKCSAIVCPYHMWTYNLDGSIRAVPDRDNMEAPDNDLNLKPVLVDSWFGFVFVNMDLGAVSLKEYLGPVAEELQLFSNYEYISVTNVTEIIQTNWKQPIDNFLEIYHLPTLHPEIRVASGWASDYGEDSQHSLEHLINEGRVKIDLWDIHSREIYPQGVQGTRPGIPRPSEREIFDFLRMASPPSGDDAKDREVPEGITPRQWLLERTRRRYANMPIDVTGLNDSQLIDRYRYFIFPNLIVTVTPDTMMVWRARPNGDDPNSCVQQYIGLVRRVPGKELVHYMAYSGRGDMPEAEERFFPEGHDWSVREDNLMADGSPGGEQDYGTFKRQQQGMRSRGFEGSRLMVQERRIRAMHEAIDLYLNQAR